MIVMGGRGGASGLSGGGGVIDRKASTRTIETTYRRSTGYKSEILEAVDGGNGQLEFRYATPQKREKTAKTNQTEYVTFKLKAGAENGDIFGVNWDKVKSVSGQTYNIKGGIKDRGFKWDGKNKRWVRK